jgi:hypothetical protein
LYCQASYDEALANAVKQQISAFAGINQNARMLPLRWTYPDAFFHFQETGELTVSVTPLDFPYNVLDPQIQHLAVVMVPDPGVNPSSWQVRLGVPAHPATIAASPTAQGDITADAGHAWEPLAAGTALGEYRIEMRADENPGLVVDGKLKLDAIQNMVLILEYAYTPRV